MQRVVAVRALEPFKLWVRFADRREGVVDLEDLFARGGVFEPLRDPERWAEVGIDEEGVVCWPNGADLAPDTMYERLKARSTATH